MIFGGCGSHIKIVMRLYYLQLWTDIFISSDYVPSICCSWKNRITTLKRSFNLFLCVSLDIFCTYFSMGLGSLNLLSWRESKQEKYCWVKKKKNHGENQHYQQIRTNSNEIRVKWINREDRCLRWRFRERTITLIFGQISLSPCS